MIYLNFNISNPWNQRCDSIRCWNGSLPIPHKFWELQILKTNSLIGLELNVTHQRDHAGISVSGSLFGFEINFNVYDQRHWDHDQNKWLE